MNSSPTSLVSNTGITSRLSWPSTNTSLADDLKEVRVAQSAYGLHLLGKVLLPDSDPSHAYPEKFVALC